MLLHVFIAPLDEGTDCCGRGVQNADLVFLDQFPEPVFGRIVGGTLVHQTGSPGRERTVDDITVSGDPSAVSSTPENIIIAMVKNPLKSSLDPQVVASSCVANSLRFSCASRCIEDEQGRFAIERFSG